MGYVTNADVLNYEEMLNETVDSAGDPDYTLLEYFITQSDRAVDSLAINKGYYDDIVTPVHYDIHIFAIAIVCRDYLRRLAGVDGSDLNIDNDRYFVKYQEYQKLVREQEKKITKYMFGGTATTQEYTATSRRIIPSG